MEQATNFIQAEKNELKRMCAARDLEASKRSIRSYYIVLQCNKDRKEDRWRMFNNANLKEEKEGVKWDSIYQTWAYLINISDIF